MRARAGHALPRRAALRHQSHQAARFGLILNQIGRRLTEELERQRPPASSAADARRVSGARAARFLRVGARLHGRLRHQELSDRAVAQPDRESLRPQQLDPRQLPCPRRLRHQRRAHGQARLGCAGHGDRTARHAATMPATGCRPGSAISWSRDRRRRGRS